MSCTKTQLALAAVVAFGYFGPDGRVAVAQEPRFSPEEVPCEQVSVTVSLPGFKVTCETGVLSADEYEKGFEKARREAADSEVPNALQYTLAVFEVMYPKNAEIVHVQFLRPGVLGTLAISRANQPHALGEIDLRQTIGFLRSIGLLGKTELEWLEEGVAEGYEILLYTERHQGNYIIPGGPRRCFAFAKYGERIGARKYRGRHFGHYCEIPTSLPITPLSDATISVVLRALPQLAGAAPTIARGASIAGEFRTNKERCSQGTLTGC